MHLHKETIVLPGLMFLVDTDLVLLRFELRLALLTVKTN